MAVNRTRGVAMPSRGGAGGSSYADLMVGRMPSPMPAPGGGGGGGGSAPAPNDAWMHPQTTYGPPARLAAPAAPAAPAPAPAAAPPAAAPGADLALGGLATALRDPGAGWEGDQRLSPGQGGLGTRTANGAVDILRQIVASRGKVY